jgi:hypothetical protein
LDTVGDEHPWTGSGSGSGCESGSESGSGSGSERGSGSGVDNGYAMNFFFQFLIGKDVLKVSACFRCLTKYDYHPESPINLNVTYMHV